MRPIGGIVLLLLCSAWLWAQEKSDQPAFRTGVELVQLDVSVLDDQRQPVRGLAAADFTVLDNGAPRPIRAFSAVDIPARARDEEPVWASTLAPDVATNQAGVQEGRLLIILMDRSIPGDGVTVRAQQIAVAAVDALGPQDLAALVSTSGVYTPQNFTADRRRLVTAIMQRDWSTESSGFSWSLDGGADPRCFCGLCVLEALTRISDAVREAPRRRKLLLFIGQGIVVNFAPQAATAGPGCEHPVKLARQKLFDSLATSNLTVHSVDPRGLQNVGDMTKAAAGGGGLDRPVNGTAMRMQQLMDARNSMLRAQDSLKILPARTGGRAIVGMNAPEDKIPDIFRESEAYYLLGFERERAEKSDERRSIEVKVARKGARAFAQRQYLPLVRRAPGMAARTSAAASAGVNGSIAGLLPDAATPLSLSASAFAGSQGDKAFVNITVDAGAFARIAAAALDVTVLVADSTGREVGSAKQTSTLGGVEKSQSASAEANVRTQIALEPGEYELRVAIADQTNGATGSVFTYVRVPKFATARFSMSDVAIEAGSAGTPSLQQVESVSVLPTTRRSFNRNDRAHAFLQVYQGTQRTDALVPVSVRARILDATGAAARDESLVLGAADFRARRADCRIALPLDRLPPGEYLLEIEASISGERDTRKLRFRVQ